MIWLVIVILALVYGPSFTSPFFQDDATLLDIAKNYSPFSPIASFPYRPVSINLFYSLSYRAFGMNPLGYHLVLFAAMAITVLLVFVIARRLLDKNKALVAAFFYAFNISLFANFYWIAVSYFSLGALFFFAAVYFYLEERKILLYLSFLLALGSNEIAIVLPLLLAGVSWYQKKWQRSLLVLTVADVVLLLARVIFIGLPQDSAYTISINLTALATVRWYFLRALNLPEGIRFATDPLILILFILFLGLLLLGKRPSIRLLIFGAFWFLVGALPFYFLPNHMSSYYLTMALFGPAIIFAEVFSGRRLAYVAVAVYFLLTVRGLDFLSKTHWIILKNTGPIGSF